MANKMFKTFNRIFFLLFQILQKIRRKRRNSSYSRRLPAELIDESLAFLPFKKCIELSFSSRNYLLLDLAKYRVKKAPKNRIRPANNARSPSPPHELIVHPDERTDVQDFLTNFASYHEDLNERIKELLKERLEDKRRLKELGKQLKEQRKQLNEQGKQLEEQRKQLEELKNQLAQQNVLAPTGEEMVNAKNLQTPKMQLTRPHQSSQRHSLLPQKQSVPQLRSEATMSVVRRTTPVLSHSIDKGLPSTSAATAQKPILNKPLIQPPMRFGNIRPLTPSTSTTRGRGKAEGVSHVVRGTPIQRPSSHSGNIEQKEQK